MQSRDYWKLEKPTSLWNTIDFTYSGTAENTPISTSRHYKHFANTGFRYSTWRVHSMHNCTPQTDLWQHEAIIYLAAFYHAENFYKWVAFLCSWRGPSPLWTSTEQPSWAECTSSWASRMLTRQPHRMAGMESWLLHSPQPLHPSTSEPGAEGALCQPKAQPWPTLLLEAKPLLCAA